MPESEFTTKALALFQFKSIPVSTIADDAGNPWFIGTDVCAALELKNISQALARLDADEKNTIILNDGIPGNPLTLIISEAGLYRLALSSRKKVAREFQRWVTHEVLPSIRKTGKYDVPASEGDMLVRMAVAYRDQQKQIKAIEEQQRQDQVAIIKSQQDLISLQKEILETKDQALLAIQSMQWVTIRQYVQIHQMQRQMPLSAQRAYATWLSTYCQERGFAMYKAAKADKDWPYEKTYCIAVIGETLAGWLRRYGNSNQEVLPEQ